VGLGYLASSLKENGYDAVIYEADRDRVDLGDLSWAEEYKRLEIYLKEINNDHNPIWDKLSFVVKDYDPDIIGITALTMKFGSVVKTAEICKKTKPECPVVIGGSHATNWPEICFQSSHVDYCISGEAEATFLNLLEAIKIKKIPEIEGVSYRDGNNVVINPEKPYLEGLDKYPIPARELLMNRDRYTSEDLGVIMTSRGCPFKCGFCSHPPRVRYRNLENVIEEIKLVQERYGTHQFAFRDDSFTVSRKRTVEFCEMIKKERIEINWDCTTRVDIIDDELLESMQEAGCNTIKIGIETGSEKILKEVNKGVTFEQMKKAAKMLNKHGIFWSAYFMYGLPTETAEDMKMTLAFMKELDPPYAGLGLYSPLPNTHLWNQGLELGLIEPRIDIDHFFSTNPKNYFFKDSKKRIATMDYDEFNQIADYMMNEFNKHNKHWSKMLNRGWSRRKAYKKDPGLLLGDLRKAAKWITG
jgi:radical SAM superfamily enzyme YgiQ (UPF0313 family)